jgi:7-keto-8-aminopelargonate synthetase-like enzyme
LAVNKHYQASSAKSVEGNTASGLLAMARSSFERALIVVEGLCSMDGDYPDLPRLIEIKSRHNAWLILDKAHALGVLGHRGYGTAEHFGIDPRRADIWMGTLSKTLAGCGGYIAGCHELVEYLRLTVGVFVYSVGMPPVIAASTLKALEILHREPERVHNLQRNGAVFPSWHLVFVVTALMNFIVVGLALFVLKPLRLRQLGQGSSARQRLLRRHNRRARLAALSLKSTPAAQRH